MQWDALGGHGIPTVDGCDIRFAHRSETMVETTRVCRHLQEHHGNHSTFLGFLGGAKWISSTQSIMGKNDHDPPPHIITYLSDLTLGKGCHGVVAWVQFGKEWLLSSWLEEGHTHIANYWYSFTRGGGCPIPASRLNGNIVDKHLRGEHD